MEKRVTTLFKFFSQFFFFFGEGSFILPVYINITTTVHINLPHRWDSSSRAHSADSAA